MNTNWFTLTKTVHKQKKPQELLQDYNFEIFDDFSEWEIIECNSKQFTITVIVCSQTGKPI